MRKIVLIFVLFPIACLSLTAQNSSFIVVGDLHYNRMEDHDLEWLAGQPGDLVKESEDYSGYTNKYWLPFMEVLKEKANSVKPPVKAVIQLGDLSEGLAGSVEKARQMNANTIKAIEAVQMPVPWIVVKGNHETYGPGANEAYSEYFVPFFRKQTNNNKITGANYSYSTGNVQIVCLDSWDKDVDILAFLEKELSSSKAKYKFVAIHKPVVPVSGLCWYVFNQDEKKRNKLLEIIAKNRAIVLTGHLHYYSVLSRKTDFGPIVQVMAISVIRDSSYQVPSYVTEKFGPSLVDSTGWSPETKEERKKILSKEQKYITSFKQVNLPGYAVIKINDDEESVTLEYFAAFGKKPYDTVNLTGLLNR